MDGVLSALESRNDVLRRRLEQSNQFGDEFVLRLDRAEELKVLLAYVDSLFYVCSFELGLSLAGLVTLGKLLDEFSGYVTGVTKHKSCVAFESSEQFCVNALLLESLLQEGVLCYQQLDILFEASTTQVTGLLRIQALDVNEVEMRELAQLCAKGRSEERRVGKECL